MALLIALLSCITSIALAFVLEDVTWQILVLVANIDIFFFWWISVSRIDYVVRQHMCWILAISIFFSIFWSLITFLYTANTHPFINLVFDNLENYPSMLGLVLTILLIVVSIMPKGLLYGFSRLGKSDIASDILDNCDNQSYQNSEKGS